MLKQINAPAIVVGAYLGILQGSDSPYRVIKYGVLSTEKNIAYGLVEHKDRRLIQDQSRFTILIAQGTETEQLKYNDGKMNVFNETYSFCLYHIEKTRDLILQDNGTTQSI